MEINKEKHEVLMRCLHELYNYAADKNERKTVRENIQLLTKLYDKYFRLRKDIRNDALPSEKEQK